MLRPGAMPKAYPIDPVELTEVCITVAKNILIVPAVISANDMCDSRCDSKSVQTYVTGLRKYYFRYYDEIDTRIEAKMMAKISREDSGKHSVIYSSDG